MDFENEGEEFLKKIELGEFPIELLENEGPENRVREQEELVAIQEYLKSDDAKSFRDEVTGQ